MREDAAALAAAIRAACVAAAVAAYEDAGIQGLCAEGRWEVAVNAMETLDLAPVIRSLADAPDAAED
ncbi:MAG TPA: hypothetical protein VFL93_04780 [Longimicrobiaceae bacterium]|nr:hypothetical protein [Longimicrobiaceae bacterium]